MDTKLGVLKFTDIASHSELVGKPVQRLVKAATLQDVLAAKSDSDFADTAAYCEQYQIPMDVCANCVIIEAKRADKVWYAACVILAIHQVDVNGMVRRQLGARKTSFAAMDKAVTMTEMEYGGITPIGLPTDWPILIDTAVATTKRVIIGSGIRGSKLFVPGELLARLPNAQVIDIVK